jgi:hypothetical protein
MTPLLSRVAALGLTCAVSACTSTQYAFVPATPTTTTLYEHAAADYPIPVDAPHGDLRVASYGFEALASADAPDQRLSTLHLRLFVANSSAEPWSLDTREQQLVIDGHGTSTPAFATASPDPLGNKPPVVNIAVAGSRLIDLFFPLPEDMAGASALPAFELTSKLQTDAGLVTETTPFERVVTDAHSAYAYDYSAEQTPEYDPDAYGYDYWDAPFWYNPGYVGFYGGVLFPPAFRGGAVYGRGVGWGHSGYYHGAAGPGFHGGAGRGGGGRGGGGHGGGGHGGGHH